MFEEEISQRRYYQISFRRPSPYDPDPPRPPPRPTPTPPSPTPPSPTPPRPPPPTPPRPPPPRPPPPTHPTTGIPRPLKKVDTLTPEKFAKGKMIAAAYEMVKDHPGQTFDEVMTEGAETRNRLLRLRGQNIDKFLYDSGIKDYMVMSDLTTRDHMVLVGRGKERGNVKVLLKGMNGDKYAVDNRHRNDTILGREKDYSYLDDLHKVITDDFNNPKIEVISFSNGGAKGMWYADKYNLPHYSIDPLLGPKEITALRNRGVDAPPLEMVRTIKPALAMGAGQTIVEVLDGRVPPNTTITQIEPLQKTTSNPIARLPADHMGETYSEPNLSRTTTGVIGRGALGSVVSGVVPIALASYMTEKVIPDAPEPAKIATTAVTGAGLTKVVSPMVGAGAVTASSLVLPISSSIAVAQGTSKLVDVVLPDDMNHLAKTVVEGGVSGATGGAVFTGTAAAQSAAVTAISSATTPAVVVGAAEGVELAALGTGAVAVEGVGAATTATAIGVAEGVELGSLSAIEAGLLTATEVTGAAAAAEGGLNPIADAAFVASAVGAGIGATVGFFTGLFG